MSAFDVIVIGAGHAGVEAAYAAARLGCSVGLCTLSRDTVAHMPCNPAVGGTAKGHLVREIDALGGLMGRAIDATGIQFKLLNRSRGPAVWSPRAQADKRRYSRWVTETLEREPNIAWLLGRAGRILVEHGRVVGLAMEDGERHACAALVVTTGTFLNGLIHVGPEQRPAGRHGEPPSRELAESIKSLGFEWGRLKTGTPPRLHRDSIDFDRAVAGGIFVEERGDETPVAVLVPDRGAAAATRSAAGFCTRTTACAISCAATSTRARSTTGRSRASARATVRRSRTRSCGSPIGSGTRSISSRKASTSTRSTSTASRCRCRARSRSSSFARCPGSRTPRCCARATRSSTTSCSRRS